MNLVSRLANMSRYPKAICNKVVYHLCSGIALPSRTFIAAVQELGLPYDACSSTASTVDSTTCLVFVKRRAPPSSEVKPAFIFVRGESTPPQGLHSDL